MIQAPRFRDSVLAACALLAAGTLAACADAPGPASLSESPATTGPTSATIVLTNDWSNGYCANVTVSNSGATPATSWTVIINMNQSTLINVWSAVQTTSGGQITVTPRASHTPIAPGSSASFTVCGLKSGTNYKPTIASVTGVGNGTGGTTPGTGGNTTGTGGATPGTGGTTTSSTGGTTTSGTGGTTTSSTGGSVASTGGSPAPTPPPAVSGTVSSAAQTCANQPMSTTGTTYYACDCGSGADADCKVGNDASDGKTPATAWRTYQKLQSQFASMKPGDTLAFCRGGSFAGNTQSWVNATCQAANVCTVRDYKPTWGSGDEGLPKLVGAALGLANSGNALHEEGYQFLNLELDGPGSGDGVFVYNDIKDVLLCNLVITGYADAINVEGSNPPANSTSDGLNARITLRGSRVVNNVSFGWLGACTGCAVEYNYFDHNGTADPLDHNLYMGGARDSAGALYVAKNERVVGNEAYHNGMGTGSTCVSTELVVHGKHDGMLIQGNTLQADIGAAADGCWGLALAPGYTDGEAFTNMTITGNKIINAGNTSLDVQSCVNCVVENNLIIQGQTAFGSNGIIVHPNGTRDASDQAQTTVQVLNNTVFFATNKQSTGITVGGEGSGYVVAGNAVIGSTSSGWNCFDYDLPTTAYASDYNLCYNATSTGAWVTEVGSLATWQSSKALDKHSKLTDPMFVNAALTAYDFTAKTGSPVRGAGDPAHDPATDIAGKTRPSPPDIGAYQN